jgi:protein-S-isoprenylcysteine O-methyltransferase Ste14
MSTLELCLSGIWILFYSYWIWAARRVARTKRGESPRSIAHMLHLTILLLALVITLTHVLRMGLLGDRFLPDSPVTTITGVLVLVASLGFAVYARRHLGQYWSGAAAIKVDHRLIRSGPYALARHPIYTGFAGGVLGTAIAVGEWRGLLAFVLVFGSAVSARGQKTDPVRAVMHTVYQTAHPG